MQVLTALVEFAGDPESPLLRGHPGGFTNVYAAVDDPEVLRRRTRAGLEDLGLVVVSFEEIRIVDREVTQPLDARTALAAITNGAEWTHGTLHLYAEP